MTSPHGNRTLKLFKIDSNISSTTDTMHGEYNYHGLESPNTIAIINNHNANMKALNLMSRGRTDTIPVPPLPHQGSISASASRTVTFVRNCRTNAAMNDSV